MRCCAERSGAERPGGGGPRAPPPARPVRIWRRAGEVPRARGGRAAQAQDGLCPSGGGGGRGGGPALPVAGRPAGARPRPRRRRGRAPRFRAGPGSRVPAGGGGAERSAVVPAAPRRPSAARGSRRPHAPAAAGRPGGRRAPRTPEAVPASGTAARGLSAAAAVAAGSPAAPRQRPGMGVPLPARPRQGKPPLAVGFACPSCFTRYRLIVGGFWGGCFGFFF